MHIIWTDENGNVLVEVAKVKGHGKNTELKPFCMLPGTKQMGPTRLAGLQDSAEVTYLSQTR